MSGAIHAGEPEVRSGDGHAWRLLARVPRSPRRALLWLPALGVAARHYGPFADALAARGVAVFVHEWRGNGASSLRAGKGCDWGYRELLVEDIPASQAAIDALLPPGVPRIIGGHSLGGQLACCRLAMAPDAADALWLVASGAPYWRAFPMPLKAALPLAYRFLPWLARINGALPGRRIGFGGNEAGGLIADWARTALSGRYAARGVSADIEADMARLAVPVRAAVMPRDWMAPASSLRFLLGKMPAAAVTSTVLGADGGVRHDHFSWMAQPSAVAAWLDEDRHAA